MTKNMSKKIIKMFAINSSWMLSWTYGLIAKFFNLLVDILKHLWSNFKHTGSTAIAMDGPLSGDFQIIYVQYVHMINQLGIFIEKKT